MEQQFKVGSVYRQRNGQIVRLHPAAWGLPASDGVVHAKRLDGLGEGHRYPTTGKEWDETMVAHNRDLIPGELTLVDGEWVGFDFKREDEPAPSLGKLLRDALARGPVVVASDPNAAMKARDLRAPAKPWAKPEAAPEPANKPQGPHAAFFALRVDVPAGHLLGQGARGAE